jgi:KipI family sensor histidine kinase inhibitor
MPQEELRTLDIRPLCDAAAIAFLGDDVSVKTVSRAWSLAAAIRGALQRGVLDVVPAYSSVLVSFDPSLTDLPRVMSGIRGAAERMLDAQPMPTKTVVVRACFGGAHGVDLETCAQELGMREARLVQTFCKPEYRVAFLGFIAGFPYLMGVPPALRLGRLAAPRPRVPAGSVAVAAGQCGIYPRQTPGGWRLLGRTLAPMFDPLREPAALLAPGDRVRFERVASLDETRLVEVLKP